MAFSRERLRWQMEDLAVRISPASLKEIYGRQVPEMSFCEPFISKNEEGDNGTPGQQVPIFWGEINIEL